MNVHNNKSPGDAVILAAGLAGYSKWFSIRSYEQSSRRYIIMVAGMDFMLWSGTEIESESGYFNDVFTTIY